jgi:hypothetical protein
VRIATAKANLASGRLSASESGNAYEYIVVNAKSPGPAFEHLAVWKQVRETSLFKMLPVAQTDQGGILAFIDSPEGAAGISEQDEIVISDVSAVPPEKSKIERPTGCKRAKRQRLSGPSETGAAMTEGAAGIRAMAEAAKERVKIQKESLKLEKKKYLLELFSNDETPAEKRLTFFQLMQDAALKELEEDRETITDTE